MTIKSTLASPQIKQALYAGHLIWHLAAWYHFTRTPNGIIRKYSTSKQKEPLAADVMKFLGGFNLSAVLLALINILRVRRAQKQRIASDDANQLEQDKTALAVLGVANFSQFYLDYFVAPYTGRWRLGGADIITVTDGFFSLVDAAWLVIFRK